MLITRLSGTLVVLHLHAAIAGLNKRTSIACRLWCRQLCRAITTLLPTTINQKVAYSSCSGRLAGDADALLTVQSHHYEKNPFRTCLGCRALRGRFAAPQTMRLDYYHTGNAKQEIFSVDRVVIEPLPWPGDVSKTLDDTNLGKYFFEVRDQKTKQVLYSRGFASIYGEWETTDEAKTVMRTFSESLRFLHPMFRWKLF